MNGGKGLNEGKLVLRHTPLGVIPHLREHLLHVGIGTNGFASHLREGCNEPVAGGVLISGGNSRGEPSNKEIWSMTNTSRASYLLSAIVVSSGLALAPAAFAQDKMTKDTMSHDTMSHDTMSHDTMSKDAMKKDDAMSHDAMKKDDAMAKDSMAKDAMKKDEIKQ